jgi:hypothetical protein
MGRSTTFLARKVNFAQETVEITSTVTDMSQQ